MEPTFETRVILWILATARVDMALFGLALAISGLATGRIMYQNSNNLLHKGLGYPEASVHAWIPRNLGRVIVRSGRGAGAGGHMNRM
eukprot:288913-Amorphochlora_amoeboformis.AAC.1